MIPCELDLTSTPFCNTKIIPYEIELPPSENKFAFNVLNGEDFTIPYITDTIQNSSYSHQLPSQAKLNAWIITINGEYPIKDQGAIDEPHYHQTSSGKSKVNISLCRRKSYHRTDLEDI